MDIGIVQHPPQNIIDVDDINENAEVEELNDNANYELINDTHNDNLTPPQYKPVLGRDTAEQIFIKADGKLFQIYFSDILYCEAMKNYTRIALKNGNRIMPLISLSKIEEQLPTNGQFLKVHRSFIVAKTHIEAIEGNQILIGKHAIPIGEQFRDPFLKAIGLK